MQQHRPGDDLFASDMAERIAWERSTNEAVTRLAVAMAQVGGAYAWDWGDGNGGGVFETVALAFAEHAGVNLTGDPPEPRPLMEKVLARDGWWCHYCGWILGYGDWKILRAPTVDHIVPRSRGGTNSLDNLVPCCGPCNTQKGTQDYDDFVAEMQGQRATIREVLLSFLGLETDTPTDNPSSSHAAEIVSIPTPEMEHYADARRLCVLLADLMVENGCKRPRITDTWIRDMERLIRLDGRTPQQVEAAIRWCQADSFWAPNIMSPFKLRKQYDRLRLAAKRDRTPTRQQSTIDALQRLYDSEDNGYTQGDSASSGLPARQLAVNAD